MNDTSSDNPKEKYNLYVVLALQGGGALGAFQAGAYQALHENKYEPDWVTGISIGAINASIIAGNKQEDRLERLNKFWRAVSGDFDWWERIPNYGEKLTNVWRVWLSMAGGVPGFFRPNYIPGPFADPNSPEASSLYNTEWLRTTLKNLVDFNFLKNYQSASHVRLSLGATKVFGGVPVTFHSFDPPKIDPDDHDDPDDRRTEIIAEHILASGALAPWFPGVKIAEPEPPHAPRLYWDGGITSNSSFRHIIEHLPAPDETIGDKHVLIFVIDLWDAFDREPKTFDEVCWRIKQTQYSSRIEQDIAYAREFISSTRRRTKEPSHEQIQLRAYYIGERRKKLGIRGDEASDWVQAERELKEELARKDKNVADWKSRRIDIVRVSYVSHPNEIPYGDALFSRTEIERRINDGYAVMSHRLEMDPPPWAEEHGLSEDNKQTADVSVAIHLF